jgi:hypothetical protein
MGPTHQATGGNAVQHNSKLMVKFAKSFITKKVKDEAGKEEFRKVGHTVRLEAERNAITAYQGRKVEYNITYGKGVSDIEAIIMKAQLPEYGYITSAKRGQLYILLPAYGDILINKKDLGQILSIKTDIADALRAELAKGKPKVKPSLSGNSIDLTSFELESFEDEATPELE